MAPYNYNWYEYLLAQLCKHNFFDTDSIYYCNHDKRICVSLSSGWKERKKLAECLWCPKWLKCTMLIIYLTFKIYKYIQIWVICVLRWVNFCFIGSDHKTCLVVPETARNFGLWGPQRPQGQKNKYGSKCLELSNSARNAKKAKNCQKEPKAWRATNLAFKGPKLEI